MEERSAVVTSSPAAARVPWSVIAFVLTWVVYLPALANDFVKFDDHLYVTENPVVKGGLTLANAWWAFTHLAIVNYHPVTLLSHMLDVTLFGLDPRGHHATSVMLHALNAALVVRVFSSLLQRPVAGVVAGLLFAIHPQRVESVAWVSERKDVLSGFFFLLMLWAWSEAHHDRRPALRVVAWVFFCVGLLSKAMLVTVPLLLLVLDVLVLGRWDKSKRGLWRLCLEKVPFAVPAAVMSWLTMLAQHKALIGSEQLPTNERLANSIVSVLRYLSKAFAPTDLSPHYGLPPGGYVPLFTAVAIVLIAFFTTTAWMIRKREPVVLAGWLWFLGMLVPVIGVVKVGVNAMADRYTYLPHLGLLLVVGALAAKVAERSRQRAALAALLAVVVVLFAWGTRQQIAVWSRTEALWAKAIAVEPWNAWPHYFVADLALVEGDIGRALFHARAAAEQQPNDTKIMARLGRTLLLNEDLAGAEQAMRFVVSREPLNDSAWLILGDIERRTGREEAAMTSFERAVAAARRHGHADVEDRARRALAGEPVTDISEGEGALHWLPGYSASDTR